MSKLSVSVNSRDLERKLKSIESNVKKSATIMNKISVDMKQKTIECFEKERDPDGKKWKKLSKNTLASREHFKKGEKILNQSGDLKRSIHRSSGKTWAKVSTDSPYAATHQYGVKGRVIEPIERENPLNTKTYLRFYTAKGWRKAKRVKIDIPARPFMGVSEKNRKAYLKKIYKYIFNS